jgi:hypothetical protein
MSEISLPRLIKKRDAAAALSCSIKHVDLLIRAGKLDLVRLGPKTVRVTLESLTRFISSAQ